MKHLVVSSLFLYSGTYFLLSFFFLPSPISSLITSPLCSCLALFLLLSPSLLIYILVTVVTWLWWLVPGLVAVRGESFWLGINRPWTYCMWPCRLGGKHKHIYSGNVCELSELSLTAIVFDVMGFTNSSNTRRQGELTALLRQEKANELAVTNFSSEASPAIYPLPLTVHLSLCFTFSTFLLFSVFHPYPLLLSVNLHMSRCLVFPSAPFLHSPPPSPFNTSQIAILLCCAHFGFISIENRLLLKADWSMPSHLLWSLTFSTPSSGHNNTGRMTLQRLNLSLNPLAVVRFPSGTTSRCRPKMCLVWDPSARRSPMSPNQVRILSAPAKINSRTPHWLQFDPQSSFFLLFCSMQALKENVLVILLQCKLFKYKTISAVEADYQMYTALRELCAFHSKNQVDPLYSLCAFPPSWHDRILSFFQTILFSSKDRLVSQGSNNASLIRQAMSYRSSLKRERHQSVKQHERISTPQPLQPVAVLWLLLCIGKGFRRLAERHHSRHVSSQSIWVPAATFQGAKRFLQPVVVCVSATASAVCTRHFSHDITLSKAWTLSYAFFVCPCQCFVAQWTKVNHHNT